MKLVEKKCPKCGAGLKIDKDATEITCEYCKMSYEVKRESNEGNVSIDDIDLVQLNNFFKPFVTFFAISQIIPFILFFIIFGIALFIILKVAFQIF